MGKRGPGQLFEKPIAKNVSEEQKVACSPFFFPFCPLSAFGRVFGFNLTGFMRVWYEVIEVIVDPRSGFLTKKGTP